MNREQFIGFMEHPSQLKGDSLILLESLLKEFPYCQTAQMLYLKNLHNQKSIHYNNQLKIAAAYAGDRKNLYQLILQPDLTSKINQLEVEIAETETKKPEIKVQGSEVSISKSVPNKAGVPATGNHQPEAIKEKPGIPIPKQEIITETEPSDAIAEKTAENKFQGHIKELEQEILKEAISAAIQSEVAHPLKAEKLLAEKDGQPFAIIKEEIKEQNTDWGKEGKHSFSEWLKLMDRNKPSNEETVINHKEKEKLNDLVNRFINEDPKIRPSKTDFFSPVNMARLSVVEDGNFVTETLANVYAKQGNYTKAIKAYENLILKYPEKSAYFAAQIYSLKEQNSK